MQKSTLKNVFQTIGLEEIESNLYLILLNNPSISVTELASKLNIHRARIYLAFDNLQKFNLIERKNNYSKALKVESPNRVLALLKNKEAEIKLQTDRLQSIIPELLFSYEKIERIPRVKIHEGLEEMNKLLTEHIEEAITETLWLNMGEDMSTMFNEEYLYHTTAQRRAKKGLKIRLLVNTNNTIMKKYEERNKEALREFKYLPIEFNAEGTVTIFNDKIILWNTFIPRAVVIYDKLLTQMHRDTFNLLWGVL
jgi:sugar-specific transcriptional regulator TrmB